MAAIDITISGVLYDKLSRTTRPVVLIGEASLTGLGIGGGPILPPEGGGGPPVSPGVPTHPIMLPGMPGWGDPRPEHPIYWPPPPTDPPTIPSDPKPPPAEGGWGWSPEYGWGYFPGPTQPGPKAKS